MNTGAESAASQYSEAVLAIASNQSDLPEKISSELKTINEIISSTEDLRLVLEHPSIADAD